MRRNYQSNIQALPDVSGVNSDWQDGTVTFITLDATSEITVEREIESLGYVVTEHVPVENSQDGQTPVEG